MLIAVNAGLALNIVGALAYLGKNAASERPTDAQLPTMSRAAWLAECVGSCPKKGLEMQPAVNVAELEKLCAVYCDCVIREAAGAVTATADVSLSGRKWRGRSDLERLAVLTACRQNAAAAVGSDATAAPR